MSNDISSDSADESSTFRSILPHEPQPVEAYGYLHIQGSFEPKLKKTSDEEKQEIESFWCQSSLVDAITKSLAVKKLQGFLKVKILDEKAPFTKLKIIFESSEAAHQAYRSWRNQKMTPAMILSHTDQNYQYSSRQLQITKITTKPMLSTTIAWTRSNPPKFRRLLHSDELSLEEERKSARFVFMTNLIDVSNPPQYWSDSFLVIDAIRSIANHFDSTGKGVEVFVPHKKSIHHCHIGMRKPEDAQRLITSLQGKSVEWKTQAGGECIESPKLFLDYADITHRSVARGKRSDGHEVERGEPSRSECTSATDHITVPGLELVESFVSEEEENVLLAAITGPYAPWAPSQVVPSKTGSVRRRVQHYGYVFDYETADVLRKRHTAAAACPPMPKIPDEINAPKNINVLEQHIEKSVEEGRGWEALAGIIERTRRHTFQNNSSYPLINQMTVNEYRKGEGIGSHIDTPSAFGDGLMSLSLNSGIVMEFRNKEKRVKKLIYLPARSLLLLSGPARYEWEHHIVTRTTDTHNGEVKPRGLRISLTLRTALTTPEDGGSPMIRLESNVYPPKWDATHEMGNEEKDALITPSTEKEHVHAVYDAIATQWHHTRGRRGVLWPGATQFLQDLPKGSIVADVGCGDGKYFPAIWEAGSYVIGTDISLPLLKTSIGASAGVDTPESRQVSKHRIHLRDRPAVAVADCMNLPLRDNSVDAAICIAVMHHLSTHERRLRCLEELGRIVKPGGRINVQAWAMEQDADSRRKFASTDVFVPFNAQPKYLNQSQDSGGLNNQHCAVNENHSVAEMYAKAFDGAEYDERKGLVVFRRYCHLYRQGDMEDLASQVPNLRLVESGYESGNHFLILEVF